MINLYIVGTHHKHQFGPCNCFNPNDQSCEAFAHYLKSQCIGYGIKTLAEEMSNDARLKWCISRTVPESVAIELGIDHSDCEPNEKEQHLLGIVNDGIVRMRGLLNEQSEKIIQKNIRVEYDKREYEWINRVSQLPNWPVLFICGSDHSSRLEQKAKKYGLRTHMIIEEWTPELGNK